ncbi:MAG: nitrate reductase cytochrome c-type subunit [Desulforhopalus sp.]
MMKRSEERGWVANAVAAFCLLGASIYIYSPAVSVAVDLRDFDHQGRKLFVAYDATPEIYMAADSGGRNLVTFYENRQYPGSPPRIPHEVDLTFSGNETDCLSCHAKGGFSQEFGKFVPVTPHPENLLCYQCHAQVLTEKKFVDSDWQSIRPPRLGRSFLSSSPPPIPHSLQLRENCIACHTGPGAVVEIRVEHSARGNCRQCHVQAVQTSEIKEFSRQSP